MCMDSWPTPCDTKPHAQANRNLSTPSPISLGDKEGGPRPLPHTLVEAHSKSPPGEDGLYVRDVLSDRPTRPRRSCGALARWRARWPFANPMRLVPRKENQARAERSPGWQAMILFSQSSWVFGRETAYSSPPRQATSVLLFAEIAKNAYTCAREGGGCRFGRQKIRDRC